MAKARPSRKAARKRGRKPAKPLRRAAKRRAGGGATAKRRPAKSRRVAKPRRVATKGAARAHHSAGEHPEAITPEMQAPPLPSPIASFTF